MKKIFGSLLALLTTVALALPALADERVLVVYFSWSGNVEAMAQDIHAQVGGDLVKLEPVEPYPSDYNLCLDVVRQEQRENARPALKTALPDMAGYDMVFLGAPVWWGTLPLLVVNFLEQVDLSGKTIALFGSSGGSSFARTVSDLERLCPNSTILKALGLRDGGGASRTSAVTQWLGEIAPQLVQR